MREPDGEVVISTGSLNDVAMIKWVSDYRPKVGDLIYATPPDAAAEIARLRQTEAALSANLADDGRTIEALEAALRPFARADLTSPGVRDTFGFDVLRARAALEKKP